MESLLLGIKTRGATSIFQYLNFHFWVAIFTRHLHTQLMSHHVRIATAFCKYQDFSLVNWFHNCRAKLVSTVKSCLGDIMISLTRTLWPLLDFFPIACPESKHIRAFKYRFFYFHWFIPQIHRYDGCIIIGRWCLLLVSTWSHRGFGAMSVYQIFQNCQCLNDFTSSDFWSGYFDHLTFNSISVIPYFPR